MGYCREIAGDAVDRDTALHVAGSCVLVWTSLASIPQLQSNVCEDLTYPPLSCCPSRCMYLFQRQLEKIKKRSKDNAVAHTAFLWNAYVPNRYYYEAGVGWSPIVWWCFVQSRCGYCT